MRVSRVPKQNASVGTSVRDSAWQNRSSSRAWRSMEPLMSHSRTTPRGRSTRRRQSHATGSPPVPRLRRIIWRGASSVPRRCSFQRRVRRSGIRSTIRSMSRSASRSSAGLIRSNARPRSRSPALHAASDGQRLLRVPPRPPPGRPCPGPGPWSSSPRPRAGIPAPAGAVRRPLRRSLASWGISGRPTGRPRQKRSKARS